MASSLRDRVRGQAGKPTASREDRGRPWEACDKKAPPHTTFNLRLNDYELTLLRWLAEQRDESMQRVAKRQLIPALEKLAADVLATATE